MTTVSQQVIWTALPRGRFPDGSLHVVAFTTPQLTTDDGSDSTLEQFPDFTRWPDVPVSWAVDIGGILVGEGVEVVTQPAPRRDLWEALFPTTTLVRSFVPAEFDDKVVRSYPVADLTRYVRTLYRSQLLDTGAATELPAVQNLLDRLAPIDFSGRAGADRRAELVAQLENELAANGFIAPGDPNTPVVTLGKAFIQHHDFMQPRSLEFSARPVPVRDFHEYVSVLGHYRDLVRLLGLAVDLKVPVGVIDLPPGPTMVQVRPGWVSALNPIDGNPALWGSRDVRPFTRTVLTDTTFLAAPRDDRPRVLGGRLPLADQSRYRLVEIDQDGAAVKLGQLARNVASGEDKRTLDTPNEQALPALRSGGIAVAEVGAPGDPQKPPMGGEMATQIDKGMELTRGLHPVSGPPDEAQLVFDAEDVTIGCRFDVWDSITHRWNSLTAREGEFNFARIGQRVPAADQAIVQAAPTSAADTVSDVLFQQQTLFNWTGWSLGAHLPGLAVPPDASAPNPPIALPVETIPDDFQLGFDFAAAKGSLPRLRYGHEYWVRGRTADLAGDSIAFGPPDSEPGTPEFHAYLPAGPIVYGRFEPVQTPSMLFGTVKTAGESSEVLVLRSNFDQPPGEVIYGQPTLPAVARHVVPPKVSVRTIEQHGLLDRDSNPPVDPDTYPLLAQRDGVMLPVSDPNPILGEVVVDYLPDPNGAGRRLPRPPRHQWPLAGAVLNTGSAALVRPHHLPAGDPSGRRPAAVDRAA